jgi:hypothetical protein
MNSQGWRGSRRWPIGMKFGTILQIPLKEKGGTNSIPFSLPEQGIGVLDSE